MKMLNTHEVAQMAHIHRDTLLRWLREGRISEPARDRNGWRVFTPDEAQAVVRYAQGEQQIAPSTQVRESTPAYVISPVRKLEQLDWDFADSNTGYLTHALHPYPAKFIPQIPNALIQELSSVGDTVLDPFCGSGTTLVEALVLRRHAIGVDANPLACLVARAKTARLAGQGLEQLRRLESKVTAFIQQQSYGTLPLFPNHAIGLFPAEKPTFDKIDFWFDPYVIDELASLKSMCLAVEDEVARELALTAFSSIIVAVSRQDSDTRYVRREKNIQPGDTAQRFARSLGLTITRVLEFTEIVESRFTCRVIHANVLDEPETGPVDMVVCSPPYPNAYSYHLYHRNRMLWLDMDQPAFKRVEIGSHRKYSQKNGVTNAATFRAELRQILDWLRRQLRPGGYACFVIGDSLIKGQLICNDRLLIEAATETGYLVEANLTRHLQDGKKSFNPVIGKIKNEHIVILKNAR
jgi:DNA modification methylase